MHISKAANTKATPTTEFTIKYKQSIFAHVMLAIILVIFLPLILWNFFERFAALHNSLLLTDIFNISYIAFTIFWFGYTCLLVNAKINIERKISLKGNIFTFPSSNSQDKPISIEVSKIKDANVVNSPRSGVKNLVFTINGKRYGFNQDNFSEKEFSIICNGLVKISERCKACQSTQVSWTGESGHCHNCETITPKNSDKFDWSTAYQA